MNVVDCWQASKAVQKELKRDLRDFDLDLAWDRIDEVSSTRAIQICKFLCFQKNENKWNSGILYKFKDRHKTFLLAVETFYKSK